MTETLGHNYRLGIQRIQLIMQNPTKELQNYAEILGEEITIINAKIDLLEKLKELILSNEDEVKQFSVSLSLIYHSLGNDIIIGLDKLYHERKRNKVKSLIDYLNKVKVHRKSINFQGNSITKHEIEEHFETIDNLNPILKNIYTQRDEFRAHHDSKYFGKIEKLVKEAPLSSTDFIPIVTNAKRIITRHLEAYNGKANFIITGLLEEYEFLVKLLNK